MRKLYAVLTALCITSALGQQPTAAPAQPANAAQYFRSGSAQDISTKPEFGVALLGGGHDLDDAFAWLCQRSNGGDFVVLRATGDDAYDPYIAKLCHVNSVATQIIATRDHASDAAVVDRIRNAEAIFISGGDQANYIRNWQGTPVNAALQQAIDRGVPIGGTSAGLAVLGEFSFSALNDTAYSKQTLANCYDQGITIAHNFLRVPHLAHVITDTHFKKRDRLGRLLTFLARIQQDGMDAHPLGIAFDEGSGGLMQPDGTIRVVGTGSGAYFYRPEHAPEQCAANQPLTYRGISVVHVPTEGTFDIVKWQATGGDSYTLDVIDGKISSSKADHSIY